jgi:hypothetical protein
MIRCNKCGFVYEEIVKGKIMFCPNCEGILESVGVGAIQTMSMTRINNRNIKKRRMVGLRKIRAAEIKVKIAGVAIIAVGKTVNNKIISLNSNDIKMLRKANVVECVKLVTRSEKMMNKKRGH